MESIKTAVKWVLFPLTLLLGAIFYLLTRVQTLKGEVRRKDAEKHLGETVAKLDEAKRNADDKEEDFRSLHRKYLDSIADDDSGS